MDVLRRIGVPLALAAVLAALRPAPAAADSGACAATEGRPACTILRPVTPPHERMPGRGPECIVIVGGLGSPTDGSDSDFFGAVLGDLGQAVRFRVARFGVDDGAFDTMGAISRNGDELRRTIHRLSPDCEAIHVLAHSMGGAVTDRAFAKGDPAADGVVTYVALASPHNGATGARVMRSIVEADRIVASSASATAHAIGTHDPTSDAIRDLSRIHAPRPVRDVEAVRMRLISDELVLRRDNFDRRIDIREYPPASFEQLEGHGHIVFNADVQRIVQRTLATGRVPPETRSPTELRKVELASKAVDALLAGIERGVGSAFVAGALAAHEGLLPLEAASMGRR